MSSTADTLKHLQTRLEALQQRFLDQADGYDASGEALQGYGARMQAHGVDHALRIVDSAILTETTQRPATP